MRKWRARRRGEKEEIEKKKREKSNLLNMNFTEKLCKCITQHESYRTDESQKIRLHTTILANVLKRLNSTLMTLLLTKTS